MAKSWWSRASAEQKLAQIDGGIECGMTAKQVSMNVGASLHHQGAAVREFAHRYNRQMPSVSRAALSGSRASGGKVGGLTAARRKGKPEFEIVSAFAIFGNEVGSDTLFDEVPQ